MPSPLFGKNITPACKYCEKAMRVITIHEQVLCSKYGVVSASYSCRHFEYDPLLRIPNRPPTLQSFSSKDFKID